MPYNIHIQAPCFLSKKTITTFL